MEIFCDGLCEPSNPGGHACWGFVVYGANGMEKHAAHGYIGYGDGMTNNLAEYTAVIEALKWAYREGHKGFVVKTDSQLVVNQSKGLWQINKEHLRVLVNRVIAGLKSCDSQGQIEWVPREQNARADELTRLAYAEATTGSRSDYSPPKENNTTYIQALLDLGGMPGEVEDGFEADFLVSNLERSHQYGDATLFSDKQKAVIVRMVEKYLGLDRAAEMKGQMRLLKD